MRGKFTLVPQFHAIFPGAMIHRAETCEDALISVCNGTTKVAIMENRFLQTKLFQRPRACEGLRFTTHTINPMRAGLCITACRDAELGAILLREGINAVAQSGRFDQILETWEACTSADGANLVDLKDA